MDLNFKNTIFVIDGIVTALIVAILAKNQEIDCIIEYKQGLDKSNHQMHEWLLANVKIRSLKKITVSPPFFLIDKKNILGSIRNMINFRREMDKYNLDTSKTYVGAITSSVICSLRCDVASIYYVDHGTGDYYSRMVVGRNKSIKSMIVKYGLKILQLPNFLCDSRKFGITLCKMTGDNFIWLDFRDFESETIKQKLMKLREVTLKNKKNTLFFAVSSGHDENGVNGDTTTYNDINLRLIQRHIGLDETVFIKYHPTLQWADNIKIDLIDKLKNKGYRVYDINEFFTGNEGFLMPAEAILKYCHFTKIVAKESSTLWNVAHCSEITKIADYSNDMGWGKYVLSLNKLVGNNIKDINLTSTLTTYE